MPETALIVDDHDGFRQLARRLLDQMGYQVIGECANGREGVQETARLSPDIVLLDVQLPDIDVSKLPRHSMQATTLLT